MSDPINYFEFDPEITGKVIDVCSKDPTWLRFQRERLELTWEHLDTTDNSPVLVARFDPLRKRGRLTVSDGFGKIIVQTEVRRWA